MKPNFKVISRSEVITGVRQARNAKQQKRIYADLCSCNVEDIEKILKEDEMQNRYNDEDLNYIVKATIEGFSLREIADHLGRDSSAIAQKVHDLRKKGVIPPVNRDKHMAQCPPEHSEVKIIKPASSVSVDSNETYTPIERNMSDGELEHYKELLRVAESALEERTKELFIERKANAELRILARMIGKAAEL